MPTEDRPENAPNKPEENTPPAERAEKKTFSEQSRRLITIAIIGGLVNILVALIGVFGMWIASKAGKTNVDEAADQAQIRLASSIVPAGTIIAYPGPINPTVIQSLKDQQWLVCNGDVVSKDDYEKLFKVIGSNWGPGDGANGFSLPNLQGMFLRGVDQKGLNDPDSLTRTNWQGVKVGAAVGSYQSDEFGRHNHNYPDGQPHGTDGAMRDKYSKGEKDWIYVRDVPRDSNVKGGNETRPKNAYVHYIIKY